MLRSRMARRFMLRYAFVALTTVCLISWVTYRLKQPHKRVRALIKNPYHLFNQDQFGKRDMTCDPDSREDEAALLGNLDSRFLKQLASGFSFHGEVNNEAAGTTRNLSQLLQEQAKIQAAFCHDLDQTQRAKSIVFVDTSETDLPLYTSLRTMMTAYIIALFSRRAFVIASPESVALEKVIRTGRGHGSSWIDWRPTTSGCKLLIDSSNAGEEEENMPTVDGECQRTQHRAVSSIQTIRLTNFVRGCEQDALAKLESLTRVPKDLLLGSVFSHLFSFPSEVEWSIDKAVQQSHQLLSDSWRERLVGQSSLSVKKRPVVCFHLDQVSTVNELLSFWRCARLVEKATGAEKNILWLLVGIGKFQFSKEIVLKKAAHYLNCSELTSSHHLDSWEPPRQFAPKLQEIATLAFLNRCSVQVSLSSSELGRLAAVSAQRIYMAVELRKAGSKTNLRDTCHQSSGL